MKYFYSDSHYTDGLKQRYSWLWLLKIAKNCANRFFNTQVNKKGFKQMSRSNILVSIGMHHDFDTLMSYALPGYIQINYHTLIMLMA